MVKYFKTKKKNQFSENLFFFLNNYKDMFLAMSVEPKTMSAIANDQGKKTILNE